MNKKDSIYMLVKIAVLIGAGLLLRVLPHAMNFTPLGAISLFAPMVLPLGVAFFVPAALLLTTDLIIGPHDMVLVILACYMLQVWIGHRMRLANSWTRCLIAGGLGAVSFFVLSNLGVFIFSGLYAHTLDGFVKCYVMAIPFFKNEIASNLFYLGALTLLSNSFILLKKKLFLAPRNS